MSDRRWWRPAMLAGCAGALLLASGDWLLGGGWGAASQGRVIAERVAVEASLARLFAGGLTGPVAACLGLVGFLRLGEAVRGRRTGLAVLLGGGAGMVFFGAVHAVYGARVLVLRDCGRAGGGGCPALRRDLRAYWDLLEAVGAAPAYAAAALLLGAVLVGRTRLPRWTAAANPLPLALLGVPIAAAPAPLGAPLAAAWPNLTLAILFAALAIADPAARR